MMAVVLVIAVITGVILAVILWQMQERKEIFALLLRRKQRLNIVDAEINPLSKEYFLMKGIIKC